MSEADWANLPDIVLTNVFKLLEDLKDRYNASQVSKTWSHAFRSPVLWRKMKFDRFDQIPVKFVQSLGQYLRELKMDCEFMHRSDKNESIFCRFFTISIQKQMNLEIFKFRNLTLRFWDQRHKDVRSCKMLGVIRDFLATQTDLIHLDLTSCEAPLEMGLDLLNKLANPGRIRNLYLENFFEWDWECDVLKSPNYHKVIDSFKSLVHLTINYGYIDSKVLELIVGNCSRSLEVIEIICSAETDENRVIPNETWAWVKKKCPQLKVDVRFRQNYPVDSEGVNVIPTEMGLRSLIVEGCCSDIIDLDPLLIQLCQFRETLEVVELDISTNGNFKDRHLIELVSSCRRLKRFVDRQGLWSMKTVKRVSELQLNGTIDLSYCELRTRSMKEQVLIEEIHRLNESIEERQGAQFKLLIY